MKIEESVVIRCSPDDVFAFLENRANDTVWMAAVVESEWLDATPTAPAIGRQGRMVMKTLGRRREYIDEVTEYVSGRRIAHRTVEGPLPLRTACICEPAEEGCRASVLADVDRFPGGPFGSLAEPVVRRAIRRGFRADLRRLRATLESGQGGGRPVHGRGRAGVVVGRAGEAGQ